MRGDVRRDHYARPRAISISTLSTSRPLDSNCASRADTSARTVRRSVGTPRRRACCRLCSMRRLLVPTFGLSARESLPVPLGLVRRVRIRLLHPSAGRRAVRPCRRPRRRPITFNDVGNSLVQREVAGVPLAGCYLENEPVKSPAEPMVCGLSPGGSRIRIASPTVASR